MIIAQYLNLEYGHKYYQCVECYVVKQNETEQFFILNDEDKLMYPNLPRLLGVPIAGDSTDLIYTLNNLIEAKKQDKIKKQSISEMFKIMNDTLKDNTEKLKKMKKEENVATLFIHPDLFSNFITDNSDKILENQKLKAELEKFMIDNLGFVKSEKPSVVQKEAGELAAKQLQVKEEQEAAERQRVLDEKKAADAAAEKQRIAIKETKIAKSANLGIHGFIPQDNPLWTGAGGASTAAEVRAEFNKANSVGDEKEENIELNNINMLKELNSWIPIINRIENNKFNIEYKAAEEVTSANDVLHYQIIVRRDEEFPQINKRLKGFIKKAQKGNGLAIINILKTIDQTQKGMTRDEAINIVIKKPNQNFHLMFMKIDGVNTNFYKIDKINFSERNVFPENKKFFKIGSHNIHGRPRIVKPPFVETSYTCDGGQMDDIQDTRAIFTSAFAANLDTDVYCVQEACDDLTRYNLKKFMKKEYPYSVHAKKLGGSNDESFLNYNSSGDVDNERAKEFTQKEKAYFSTIIAQQGQTFDNNSGEPSTHYRLPLPAYSGIEIFSRHPIRAQHSRPFKNKHVAISDSLVCKGIIYAKIDLIGKNKGIDYAHVFNWHPSPYVPMKYSMYKGGLGYFKMGTDILMNRLSPLRYVGTEYNLLNRFNNAAITDFRQIELAHINQIEETNDFINTCLSNSKTSDGDGFEPNKHAIFITGDSNINRNDVWEYPCNLKNVQEKISKKKTESEMSVYNRQLLELKVTNPDNGGDEITCGIKEDRDNKPKYKDNVNCFMDQLQSNEDYKPEELKILDVLETFLSEYNDEDLKKRFWPLGTETHGKDQFEILKAQGVITGEWRDLGEQDKKGYNRKLDYCLLTREAEDLITQLYNYYLLNKIKLEIDLSTGNQVEGDDLQDSGEQKSEAPTEVKGFVQYIFQSINNKFIGGDIYQNEVISKLFLKTVLIPFVEKYYETPETVFSILSRNQQLTDRTATPGLTRFNRTTVSEEPLTGVNYNSDRQAPLWNEVRERARSLLLRFRMDDFNDVKGTIQSIIIRDERFNNPNLYYSPELERIAETILSDSTIRNINDESLREAVEADKISYLPTTVRSKYRLTLHNERVGGLVSSLITFTSLLKTKGEGFYNSMKSLTDNIVKVTDKYRNIIELYRMECSSVCLSDEFKRTLLLLKAGVPKLKLNPLYWREFANIEMAKGKSSEYTKAAENQRLRDMTKIANQKKILVANDNFSVNAVKTLGLTHDEIFYIKYWMSIYNNEKTYELNMLGQDHEESERLDRTKRAIKYKGYLEDHVLPENVTDEQLRDATTRHDYDADIPDEAFGLVGGDSYLQRGGNREPWFFARQEDIDDVSNIRLQKTYSPDQTFDNIKKYSVGVDNVLRRESPFTDTRGKTQKIKGAVRQQPFTWEGPRKSNVRSYSGNSLVAGPFWPVDLYEIIDHHFYKPFFEEKDTNNIKYVNYPVYCDYNICRPVIKKTKGIQVVSKYSADDECLRENNTTKELASMWYDTADHYPIIGTYLFGNNKNERKVMNSFKINFLDKPENQYINQNSEDVTCERRERNLGNNIIMKEFNKNWNVTSSGLFGLHGTNNTLNDNVKESKYHKWYEKKGDVLQETQDIKNINTMSTIVDNHMSELLTDSPNKTFWNNIFPDTSRQAYVNRGGKKKTKKSLKSKTRKRKNKKTRKRTSKRTRKTRRRARRRKSNKKRRS